MRRLFALAYDLCVLAGLAFVAATPLVVLAGGPPQGPGLVALQIWILIVCGGYVTFAWQRSGMTLGMQAWGLEVTDACGNKPGPGRAILRFVYAVPCVGLFGLGLWWSLVDRDGRGLHDLLSGTGVRRRAQDR